MRTAVIVGAMLCTASATGAIAQCDQSSLAGKQVFVFIAPAFQLEGATVAGLEGCVFDIDDNGRISPDVGGLRIPGGLPGTTEDLSGIFECVRSPVEGNIMVAPDCSMQLDVSIQDLGCRLLGLISRDRTVTSGVGACPPGALGVFPPPPGSISFLFNLIRQ